MPVDQGRIQVQGLRDFHRVLAKADKETRLGVRKAERQVAEPVKVEAQRLAAKEIRRIGTEWSAMRIGVTTKLVYVAPKRKRKQGSPRPNLANLLGDKAMTPAVESNKEVTRAAFQEMLDHMAANFNRGTP